MLNEELGFVERLTLPHLTAPNMVSQTLTSYRSASPQTCFCSFLNLTLTLTANENLFLSFSELGQKPNHVLPLVFASIEAFSFF